MSGQDYRQLTLFPEDSHASLIVSQENAWEQKTKDICGQNLCGLSERLSQELLLVRMCLVSYLPYMMMYAPTWKVQDTKAGRSVFRLTLSARTLKDTGWQLWPSPRASQDFKPIRKQTPQEHCGKHGKALCAGIGISNPELIGQHINPRFSEWLMGFPEGWTDV